MPKTAPRVAELRYFVVGVMRMMTNDTIGSKLLRSGVPLALALVGCGGDDSSRLGDTTAAPGTTGAMTSDSGDDDNDDNDDANACVPGMQSDCTCPDGTPSFQVCDAQGSGFDACVCDGADDDVGDTSDDESTGAGDPCGNGVCDEDLDEDCASCEADCGVCEPCTEAPSCEGAAVPPVIDTHAMFLDDPMAYIPPPQIIDALTQQVEEGGVAARLIAAALAEPAPGEPPIVGRLRDAFDAHPFATQAVRTQLAFVGMDDPHKYSIERGVPTHAELVAFAGVQATTGAALVSDSDPFAAPCDNPRMRVRVAQLTVHEEDDDFLNDEIYCAITSEASGHAELKVTPITTALDEGDSVEYSLDGGLIWGQAELTAPMGNILVTYNCIESDTANGYPDLLMAIGDAVGGVDGKEVGVDGWVFPAAGVVTNLLAGALTLDGDDLLFNGSQVIPETEMLALTYGAWWSVRREGTNLNSDWDWELRMEIWGCHDYGTGGAPG